MPELVLEIDWQAHRGFRQAEVGLSLEQGTNTFSVAYAERWAIDGARSRISPGDGCTLKVGDEVLLDGYVDAATVEYADDHLRLECQGRARTADLVDCSAVGARTQWSEQGLEKILRDLSEPFDVSTRIVGDPGRAFSKFSVQRGETAFAAIARAARLRGFLPYTIGGELVLARAGSVRTSTVIRRGANVVRASRTTSWAERYSHYRFRGQTGATDDVSGKSASQLRGEVRDPSVARYRPFLVASRGQDGPRDLGARAILERNTRAGRGDRLSCTVVGWHTAEGLWAPNTLVRVEDDWLDVSAELLVVSVRFRLDAETGKGGYVTELELTRPEAFDMAEYPAAGRGTWA